MGGGQEIQEIFFGLKGAGMPFLKSNLRDRFYSLESIDVFIIIMTVSAGHQSDKIPGGAGSEWHSRDVIDKSAQWPI